MATTSRRFEFTDKDIPGRCVVVGRPSGAPFVNVTMRTEGDLFTVCVRWDDWLSGLRALALDGVVPIAELSLWDPASGGDLTDPHVMASHHAEAAVLLARASGRVEAPSNHSFWAELRHHAGMGFYVGFFAGRRSHGAR